LNGIRTFIALEVSNKTVIEKLQEELTNVARWRPQEVKPIEKQNFHFTLFFLGEVDLGTIDKIKGKLSELQFEPIKISYTGLGGFPNPSFARVVWMEKHLLVLLKRSHQRWQILVLDQTNHLAPISLYFG
jgi:2'-5' RNA ligase